MKLLQELTKSKNYLNIRVRDGRIRVTYGNKGVDIYNAVKTKRGLQLTPVSPWEGKLLTADSWQDAKRQVETQVFAAFGGATQPARLISKKLGLTG
jgi:hypothetical protein